MLTQFQLKNKMKVLLVESHKSPVVAVQVWVKTGSADEKKGEEGISHFIEHLVFKGTRKYGVGEIAKTVEGSGGELNAYTSFDNTVFYVTLSRDDLTTGLDVIAEMMGFPKFDLVEIDREREVVIEEIKRSFDDPYRVASQQMFSTQFKKHPYGIPVIGYDHNIRDVSRKTLLNYYHRRYVPSNMTLIVTGDFDRKTIRKKIEEYFAGFEPHKLKTVKRVKEPAQKSPRLNYTTAAFREGSLSLTWPIPSVKHKDVPALDVLSFVLGQGDSSRLMKRLRLENSLVSSVSAGSFTPLDGGLFAVTVNFSADKLSEIRPILTEELTRLVSELPSWGEVERARINLESDEVYSLETVDGLARKVGSFQLLLGDPNYVEKYLKQVQALKPQDLLKVARKYFDPKKLNATLMLHHDDAQKFTKDDFSRWVDEFKKAVTQAAKQKIAPLKEKPKKTKPLKVALKGRGAHPEILKTRLNNGALLLMRRNPEIPTISMKVGFLGGQRNETPSNLGITTILSNTWTSGSQGFTEEEINVRIEGAAASLSAFGGRNSVGLSFDTMTSKYKDTMPVFADVLLNPLFDAEPVAREVHQVQEALKHRNDHPSSVAVQKFLETLYAGHPYAYDIMGTPETLATLNSGAVMKHLKAMRNSDNAVFVVTGDFDPRRIEKEIDDLATKLGRGQKHTARFQPNDLKGDKNVYYKLDKEQSHIIVGYRGLTLTSPDRYALMVMQSVLAGQGGRLFIELRDKASLAYSVAPIQTEGIETGYFGAYIGCTPDKGPQAIRMIHEEFQKLVDAPIPHGEFERAKRYLVGRNHIDLQRNAAQASAMLFDELYGIDANEAFQFAEHVNKVTAQDVQRLAQKIFSQACVRTAVGPIQPFGNEPQQGHKPNDQILISN